MKKIYLIFLFLAMTLILSTTTVSGEAEIAPSSELNLPNDSVNIRINEVMFYPEGGNHEWVELKNAGSEPVDISGYGLTDEDGNWYRIPDALPDVPVDAFVVARLE